MTKKQDFFKNIQFVKSITDLKDRPDLGYPEIAFAGRSNVGKSSLLNALFNIKRLAKVSSTPGKTRLVNFFQADDMVYFVDLPGYGFAKISKSISRTWQKMIETYLLKSAGLKIVCLLIDSRHELMKADALMADWLNFNRIPYVVILTKCDKLSKNKLNQQIKYFQSRFPDHHVIPFSIRSNALVDDLKKQIRELL